MSEPPPTLERRALTLFASVTDQPPRVRYPMLFGESLLLSGAAFGLPWLLGADGTELGIFCLFFTAISLHARFVALLDEHRALIFERGFAPRRAHGVTAWSILAVFLGVCASYATLVGVLEPRRMADIFGFVLEATRTEGGDLLSRDFGDPLRTLTHNLGVLSGVVLLCLVYRAYGAVLVLGWNASTWVVALGALTTRAAADSAMGPLAFRATAVAALLPHLVLELAGYVLAAMAGIFVSRAFTRYDWNDAKMGEILQSSALILLSAAAILAVAAVVEGTVPALVLGRLR